MSSKRKPGFRSLAFIVIYLIGMAAVPVVEYRDTIGHDTRTAVIDEIHRSTSGRSSEGVTADFHLADGTTGGVYLGYGSSHPDEGDSIQVYWDADRWVYVPESSWTGWVWPIALEALGLVGLVWWIRARRRSRAPQIQDDDPYQYGGPSIR